MKHGKWCPYPEVWWVPSNEVGILVQNCLNRHRPKSLKISTEYSNHMITQVKYNVHSPKAAATNKGFYISFICLSLLNFFMSLMYMYTKDILKTIKQKMHQVIPMFKAGYGLTLVMLNKLRCHLTSNFQPIRLLDPGFLIEIHIVKTNSADPDQLASSLFAKTGHVVFSMRRYKVSLFQPILKQQ